MKVLETYIVNWEEVYVPLYKADWGWYILINGTLEQIEYQEAKKLINLS